MVFLFIFIRAFQFWYASTRVAQNTIVLNDVSRQQRFHSEYTETQAKWSKGILVRIVSMQSHPLAEYMDAGPRQGNPPPHTHTQKEGANNISWKAVSLPLVPTAKCIRRACQALRGKFTCQGIKVNWRQWIILFQSTDRTLYALSWTESELEYLGSRNRLELWLPLPLILCSSLQKAILSKPTSTDVGIWPRASLRVLRLGHA